MSGYGLSSKYHLSTILKQSLTQSGYRVDVINASVSGDTTQGGLNRIGWLVEDNKIDVVVLCLGANDMLRGINPVQVKNNLNKIIKTLKKNKIKILLVGMLSQEVMGVEYKKKFDAIYPNLAKKFNLAFVPFLLKGVALKPEFNLNDGKHPNSKGVKLIGKNIEKEIINLLKY